MQQNSAKWLRAVRENVGWMLGSILLATTVWYISSSAQNPVEQRRLSARLTIQIVTDEGMLVLDEGVKTAQVTIRAPRSVWDVLEPEDISVTANLTKLGPGKHTAQLTGILSSVRRGQIIDIQPSQITVELARRSEQLVNVNVVRSVEPPPGFAATTTLNETQARITGPENSVKRVAAVQARLNMQDQRVGFTRRVALVAVDVDNREVSDVQIAPAEVTVTVDIQPRPDVTELSVLVNLTGNLPAGYVRRNYSWDPRTVLVRGDRLTIAEMNGTISTDAVDLTGKTETFTQRVKLVLPAGVTLPDAVEVTVTVEIAPQIVTREFENVPVQPQGLDPADFAITVQPDRVSVIVSGPQSLVESLTAGDIRVIAPLTGLGAGKSPVTLQASVSKPGLTSKDIVIPNARAEVTIIARNPTPTPTAGPTRTPLPPPTAAATQ